MRKRIIIIILVLIIGGGAWYFYNKSKSTETATTTDSGFKSFFPFGNSANNGGSNDTIDQDNQNPPIIDDKIVSPFKQLTSQTVSGFSAFTTKTVVSVPATTPKGKPTTETITDHVLRYISRNNGYVYEIKNSGIPVQISNIYAANIYEALFADSGKTAILRFLRDDAKTIASYSVPIPEKNIDGTRTQKDGTYLPDGISSMAVSTDGKTVARLTVESGSSVLFTTTTTNTNRKEIIRSPFREWLVSWGGNNIFLQTKASGTASGFLYQVDTTNKRLTRVLGDIKGLTTSVSPKGTYILYSESNTRGFVTRILTTSTGAVRNVGNSILPEKCVWLQDEDLICAGGGTIPEGTYPDTWYAGTTKFSDQLFRIYTGANIFDVLHSPTDGQSFDMTNLQINENLGVLYFIDKQSGILWQFSL
jgi:hypothetical protein